MTRLQLRPLAPGDQPAALAAQSELQADNFSFLLSGWSEQEPWTEYLQRLEAEHQGRVPEGRVPSTFLVGEAEGTLVGRVSLRHRLSPELERFHGHIGYGVRPAYRGRGYAGQMLRQALLRAGDLGLAQVLLTCAEENAASRRVIEAAGGIFEAEMVGYDGGPWRRYWISCASG